MKANNTTAISITTPSAVSAVIPKPRKIDIINAAIKLAHKQAAEKNAEQDKLAEAIVEKIKIASLKEMKKNPVKPTFRISGYENFVEVRFAIKSTEINELRKELKEASQRTVVDDRALRMKLTGQLSNSDRVDAILGDEKAVQALEAVLAKL